MPYAVSTFVPAMRMPSGPLIVPLEGLELTQSDIRRVRHVAVGGVILFSRNYEDKRQLSDLIAHLREVSDNCLVTVDHEGGRIQRFVAGWTQLPPPACLGEIYSEDRERALRLSKAYGLIIANELKCNGIDLSFAPVLDLGINQAVIGDRAFHSDPAIVYDLGRAWIAGAHAGGMQAVGKHFPGHGSVAVDSHVEVARDARAANEVKRTDGEPFRRVIEDGILDAVMSAHVAYGDDKVPATFSTHWLQTVLREEWGFQGLVFSDDLMMAASLAVGEARQTVGMALKAGCDMILVCYKEDALEQLDALLGTWPEDEMMPYMERLKNRWRVFSGRDMEVAPYDKQAMSDELNELGAIPGQKDE